MKSLVATLVIVVIVIVFGSSVFGEPGWKLINDQEDVITDNDQLNCSVSPLRSYCNNYDYVRQVKNEFSDDQDVAEEPEEISWAMMNIFKNIPYFDLRHQDIEVNEKCARQLHHYTKDLKKMKLWALQMFDANAKIPSGILNGNVNQYGDFDTCMKISQKTEDNNQITGKYCLASLQLSVKSNASKSMRHLYDLTQSHHVFRSRLEDPGHRVPRFSSINWAICVPNECTANEIEQAFKVKMESIVENLPLSVEVLLDPLFCQMKSERKMSDGFKIVSALFLGVILLTLIATYMDSPENSKENNLILSFSLKRNCKSLFSLERSKDDVTAVHGIRFLNAALLIFSHKSMAVIYKPFINRTYLGENLAQSWTAVGRSASLYTDPFLMFSGMLTCYTFIGRLRSNKSISLTEEFSSRLMRLVPSLGALILFCTWILPEMGSGPQWPLVIDYHAEICKTTWWRNFLFIHNYFGFENMCLTHTHHVGIDTELFAVGVLIVYWFGINPERTRKALWYLTIASIVSTVARFYVSYTMNLANYLHFGTSIQQMFDTANYMYIIPPHRFTVYAMGLILGILLKYPTRKLTRTELRWGWILTTSFLGLTIAGILSMTGINYEYSRFDAAMYAAFAPITWCLIFGWIVYATHHGYANWIGNLMSWKYFTIWTRLSYAVYLTQFPIFFFNVGKIRSSEEYGFVKDLLDLKEFIWIMLLSIVLTLLFDLPFQNIKKLIFSPPKKVVKDVK